MNTLPENCIEEKSLTVEETSRLKALEKVIKSVDRAFVKKGEALAEIRDNRLYRTKQGRTWEGYCREVWDMGRNYADKLISAAEVVENLGTAVPKFLADKSDLVPVGTKNNDAIRAFLPANESQARVLSLLNHEEQGIVWEQLLEKKLATATDDKPFKITAMAVTKAVSEFKGERLQDTINRTRQRLGANREVVQSEEFVSTWDQFLLQVEKERHSGWRNTSRKLVFELLSTLTSSIGEAGKKNLCTSSVEYQMTDLEKLHAAGLNVYRISNERTGEYFIERWDVESGKWEASSHHSTQEYVEQAFAELMQDPKNIQA